MSGAKCTGESTGEKGDGPVHKRAVSLLAKAQRDRAASIDRLADLRKSSEARLAPLQSRIDRLSSADSTGSVSWAQAQLSELTANRDQLIDQRIKSDPRWASASAPAGFGEKLITLLTIVLQQPVLWVLVLTVKIITTVFELLGTCRAHQFARWSETRRKLIEGRREQDNNAAIDKVRRKTNLKGAHLSAAHELWSLKREFRNAREFDRKVGFPSFKASFKSTAPSTGE